MSSQPRPASAQLPADLEPTPRSPAGREGRPRAVRPAHSVLRHSATIPATRRAGRVVWLEHAPDRTLCPISNNVPYPHRRPGRPPLEPRVSELILRLARENTHWGYVRIVGELRKLGITVSPTLVRNVLRRAGVSPAPERGRLQLAGLPAPTQETRSWLAICSPSTPSGCGGCPCCSSCRSGRAGSNTSPARPTRIRHG
jgi:hypothetical protein